MFGYRLLLKIENLLLKYYSKIIFKYVNSAVKLSFKAKFLFFRTYDFRKQYTGPKEMKRKRAKHLLYRYSNSHLMLERHNFSQLNRAVHSCWCSVVLLVVSGEFPFLFFFFFLILFYNLQFYSNWKARTTVDSISSP